LKYVLDLKGLYDDNNQPLFNAMVLEKLKGGELFYHIKKDGKFSV
jgi:hypothetical protein